MNSITQIANLLYGYSEHIAAGDFAGAADMFRHAKIKMPSGSLIDSAELLAFWTKTIILDENGTPGTRMSVTNPIISVDEERGTATSRSQYTVIKVIDGSIQIIAAGRYHDQFERIDGDWWFVFRDYTMLDMVGDVSGLLRR